jgi:hypothetical protein
MALEGLASSGWPVDRVTRSSRREIAASDAWQEGRLGALGGAAVIHHALIPA